MTMIPELHFSNDIKNLFFTGRFCSSFLVDKVLLEPWKTSQSNGHMTAKHSKKPIKKKKNALGMLNSYSKS